MVSGSVEPRDKNTMVGGIRCLNVLRWDQYYAKPPKIDDISKGT
jgi:hypothetical protein